MSNSLRRVRNNQKSRKAIMSPSISFFLAIFFSASLFAQNYTIQKATLRKISEALPCSPMMSHGLSNTHGTYLRADDLRKNSWQVAQVPGAGCGEAVAVGPKGLIVTFQK
jgi:hypothetical protein